MMTTRTMRWAVMCVLMAAVGLTIRPALAELPDEAAQLAPADAAVLLELDDLAALRADLERDPLMRYLREQTPAKREPAAWRAVQEALGLSGEEVFDRYFGEQVAIVGQGTKEGGPGVIFSRVSEDHAEQAVEKLNLEQIAEPGAFTLYRSSDDKGRLAFGDGWLAMADPKHEDYLRQVLSGIGEGESLSESETYQQWTGKVAEGAFARLFVHDPMKDQVHSAAAERDGGRLMLRYAGQNPQTGKLLDRVSDAEALDFGPLPTQTLSATTINLRDRQPDERWVKLMDRLMSPASYEEDVLPKLGAPVVTFLGEVKGEQLEPRAGFSVPVLGMAIKLRDNSVAEDLDRAMQGGMLFANMATMQMDVDPIETHSVEHEGVSFEYADVGKPLAQRLNVPGLAGGVQVAFGRIDDWYVVSTNADFFRWCIDAANDGDLRLSAHEDIQQMNLSAHDRPVTTTFVRTPELAAHVRTWLAHVSARKPEWVEDAEQDKPETRPGRAIKGLTLFAGVLEHYEAASLQLFGGEEDQTLRAEAVLQRQ